MDFSKRDEIIFITYEDVIKSPYIKVLMDILSEYREYYDQYLNFPLIEPFVDSFNMFLLFFVSRQYKNILHEIRAINFDTEGAWKDIYPRNEKLFEESVELAFSETIRMMLNQKSLKHAYIWTEEYDKRIHHDLSNLYKFDKLSYISGPFDEAISAIDGITGFVLNDVELINTIIAKDKIKCTDIFVAKYRYNYDIDEDGTATLKIPDLQDLKNKHIFKITFFSPI